MQSWPKSRRGMPVALCTVLPKTGRWRKKALDLGFTSFFRDCHLQQRRRSAREVARKVPPDRLLIETDAPYLAPVPFRGKPNLPQYVTKVAECIAALRSVSVEEIAKISSRNFSIFFGSAPLPGKFIRYQEVHVDAIPSPPQHRLWMQKPLFYRAGITFALGVDLDFYPDRSSSSRSSSA